ncbi:MAG TPA: hypothetical protein VH062_02380 [Polyangiaceae bacterium]|jgi:hypothetical protein|nr:hypothetical protein [Polyangiaceae bacterium]
MKIQAQAGAEHGRLIGNPDLASQGRELLRPLPRSRKTDPVFDVPVYTGSGGGAEADALGALDAVLRVVRADVECEFAAVRRGETEESTK